VVLVILSTIILSPYVNNPVILPFIDGSERLRKPSLEVTYTILVNLLIVEKYLLHQSSVII
jgi:hypothetical protein